MPRVSVIVPTHNYARYIGEAIQSVLDQTYQDFELVVVDDGSTDETAEVVSQFVDDRIIYIYQENQGLAAARNIGIRHSTGEYIAFLDADDWFLPEKLRLQVQALDDNRELGLVCSGWLFVDANGRTLREVHPWETCSLLDLEAWLIGCPFVVHGVLARRDAVEEAGLFDEDLAACEDWDLFLRMAALGTTMDWMHSITCKYRIHQDNMTRSSWRLKEKTRVLDKFFRTPRAALVDQNFKQRAYANALLQIAGRLYLGHEWEEAKRTVVEALDWLPELIGPPLVDTVRNWALDPWVSEPEKHTSLIFDHLPESVLHLRTYRKRVLAEVHMDSAFSSYARGNPSEVLTRAASGIVYDPSWLCNRGVWSISAISFTHLLRCVRKARC